MVLPRDFPWMFLLPSQPAIQQPRRDWKKVREVLCLRLERTGDINWTLFELYSKLIIQLYAGEALSMVVEERGTSQIAGPARSPHASLMDSTLRKCQSRQTTP
jgi:hypothetical protein